MRPPVRRALRAALACTVIVAVLAMIVPWLEARLVFFPYAGEHATPGALGIPYTRVPLTTADGERLAAWQLEPERPVADVVYFHGNGGNLSVWLPALAALHRMHLRVFAVDYRGYGLSTGTPTEAGVYRDAEAAVDHVRHEREAGTRRLLVYWGRSLGGAIAAHAARVAPPDGLILESAFPDKASVIRRQPILRALNVFAAYRFSTVDALADVERPVLVMHGDRDSVIPYRLGQELFERLTGPKTFVTIPGADHNDLFDAGARDYWNAVLTFIASLRPAAD